MSNNLAARATAKNGAPANRAPSLTDSIRSMEGQFQLAAPKGAEAAQLVRDALTLVRQTPKLAECDQASVLGSLMSCAQLGLRPGSALGHAYLLPMYDSRARGHKATLVLGYRGLIELAFRSGQVKSIESRVIYENDEYHVAYGLNANLIHTPFMGGDRGKPVAYYAVFHTVNGGYNFEVMSQHEMEQHRDRYALAKNKQGQVVGPWRDNFVEMARKTMIRKIAPYLPKSTDLMTAIAADERVRVDLAPDSLGEGTTPDAVDGEAEETAAPVPTTGELADLVNEAQIPGDEWIDDAVGRKAGGFDELADGEKVKLAAALRARIEKGDNK